VPDGVLKLHRDLGVTQKTAWHLAHRIRETWQDSRPAEFSGEVEADESYLAGKRRTSTHARDAGLVVEPRAKRLWLDSASVGASVSARRVVPATDGKTLKGFVWRNTKDGTRIYTDTSTAYSGLPGRKAVNHNIGQIRGWPSSHERARVLLGYDEAWVSRHVPLDESEAPSPLCGRVQGAPQSAAAGYGGPDKKDGAWWRGRAVEVCRPYKKRKS